MKKIIFFISIFMTVFTACKDDVNQGNGSPATVGDEIQFSANHAEFDFNVKDARTIYGDRKGNSYPIYWVNNDEIGIYCPQAANSHEFHYKVVVDDETSSKGTLAKINPGENGLQWGTKDIHHFYAIYPASASTGGMSATEVKCNIPVRQNPERIEFDGSKTYTAYPNMDYAYMYAHSSASRLTDGDKSITLEFKPLVTVLEITVNGPKAGTVADNAYQVSQVSIRSNENIAGDFLLTTDDNFTEGEDGKCTAVENGTVSNLITIPTYMNGAPVTLRTGQKLVVKAFMLPYAAPDKAQTAVTVNMVGQGSNTKILSTADIQAHKINITSLPALRGTDFYYWMTAMDKRTYFSQLSIPGTHNSYSVNDNVSGSNTLMPSYQKLSIEKQFAAGARAFSFMVGFGLNEAGTAVAFGNSGTSSSYTNWNDDYNLYIYDGNDQSENLETALNSYVRMLDDAITNYKNKYQSLQGRECQEFIVLNINYKQIANSGENNQDKYKEVKRWIREIDRILNNYKPSSKNGITLETNLGANTTIQDLMGKIVVFVNYQCPDLPDKEGAVSSYTYWGTKYGEDYDGYTYNPASDAKNYVFLRNAYDMNGNLISGTLYSSNDRDIDYPYYMIPENSSASGITVYKQHLERLNNPISPVEAWTDKERVTKKINMVEDFFKQAITNNTGSDNIGLSNWYINNLGGFCVINDEKSYGPTQGQSGNTVTAANEINKPIYEYLINEENNSGPIGVVLMNFFGCDYISNVGVQTDVYGKWLPQTIIENNFRFELKRTE